MVVEFPTGHCRRFFQNRWGDVTRERIVDAGAAPAISEKSPTLMTYHIELSQLFLARLFGLLQQWWLGQDGSHVLRGISN